jgi:fructokinase
MSVWVCGEVLIDELPSGAVVGGGPANTAKALARLGHEVAFIDGISTDVYGVKARAELAADGVDLSLALTSDLPTAVAEVSLAADGGASYVFKLDKTATFDFNSSWLPDPSRYKPQVLHIGTLATLVQPGADVLFDWALACADFAPVVFDPNIRPQVLSDREKYVALVEKWIGISSVVKLSDDDFEWLYPGKSPESIANQWLQGGVALVVMTRGADGLVGYTSDGVVEVAGEKVNVVDTVGAGDTVGAIVVQGLITDGLLNMRGSVLKDVLRRAAVAAAITCSRAGAQPPYAHEIREKLGN